AEGDRLGRLEVREARHDDIGVALRLRRQYLLKAVQYAIKCVEAVAHVQPEVEGDLVIPGAGRVEPARRGTDQLREPALDVHMDVLERLREGEFAALDLGPDLLETLYNLACIGLRDNA